MCFLFADLHLIKNDMRPVFSVGVAYYKDGGSVQYNCMGYRILKIKRLSEETVK